MKLEFAHVEEKRIPVMSITITDEDGNNKIGYLSPFRGYAFQVSYTKDGSGSYNASPVIGFGNVIKAFDLYRKDIDENGLSSLSIYGSNSSLIDKNIMLVYGKFAMLEFISSRGCSMCDVNYTTHMKTFNEFIDNSYEWVKSLIK